MERKLSLMVAVLALLVLGCGDEDDGGNGNGGGTAGAGATAGAGGTGGTGAVGGTGGTGATGGAGGGEPSGALELLYDGPVGGQLSGWDNSAPWPMVALAQQGSDWVLTLLRIEADGTLTDNVADRILVWGWRPGASGAPEQLYDGPVGGTLPGWSASAPQPLVAVGGPATPSFWWMTLLRIQPDGTLTDNVAERVIIWGWANTDPDAPSVRYDGPVGGQLPNWSAAAPEPLVAGGELGSPSSWAMTLFRIAPDGTISENLSSRVVAWSW